MNQKTLDGRVLPKPIETWEPNVVTITGSWVYEDYEEFPTANIVDVRVWHCSYVEFEPDRNECMGGCDSKGGLCAYCVKLNTKMSILGRPWSVKFE
jgi:hypothetical protein